MGGTLLVSKPKAGWKGAIFVLGSSVFFPEHKNVEVFPYPEIPELGRDFRPLHNCSCVTVVLCGRMILMRTKPRTSFSTQRSTRLLDSGRELLRMKKPF